MTLKPQCDCSTCACANAPGRSGYCLNCEVTDSGAPGTHAQHTPGPWATDNGHAERAGIQVWDSVHGWIIADVVDDQHDNGNANAALISAAPALLEALRDCRESLEAALEHITKDGMTDENEDLYYLGIAASDNAKAALAAAEGGATKHVHSFSIWHDRQDRPARGYSRCACGVEPGDDWAEGLGDTHS